MFRFFTFYSHTRRGWQQQKLFRIILIGPQQMKITNCFSLALLFSNETYLIFLKKYFWDYNKRKWPVSFTALLINFHPHELVEINPPPQRPMLMLIWNNWQQLNPKKMHFTKDLWHELVQKDLFDLGGTINVNASCGFYLLQHFCRNVVNWSSTS